MIVDGHWAHTAAKTRKCVESTHGRLRLYYLPPYSPELNPDEWIWKNVKHDRLGRLAVRSVEEMRVGITTAVSRLQASHALVRGFFRDPDLTYIQRP